MFLEPRLWIKENIQKEKNALVRFSVLHIAFAPLLGALISLYGAILCIYMQK